ncbi:unnamed protein product [Auanema sp. JU1783]|nr:unnamed protein product [Auanema sp. JU1783]
MASGFGILGNKHSLIVFVVVLTLIQVSSSRRRISHSQKAFDQSVNLDWNAQESEEIENEKLKADDSATLSPKIKKITEKSPEAVKQPKVQEVDETVKLLNAAADIFNLTRTAEEKYGNSSIYWIDANYKALDLNLTVSEYNECKAWRKHWNISDSNDEKVENGTKNEKKKTEDLEKYRIETEVIDSKKRLKALGIDDSLLKEFKAVGIVYKEICQEHTREMWFRGTDDAKKLGITEVSPICEPFKEALNPDTMTLAKLAMILNELINLQTDGELPTPMPRKGYKFTTVTSATEIAESEEDIAATTKKPPKGQSLPQLDTTVQKSTDESTSQSSPTLTTSQAELLISERDRKLSKVSTTTAMYLDQNEVWEGGNPPSAIIPTPEEGVKSSRVSTGETMQLEQNEQGEKIHTQTEDIPGPGTDSELSGVSTTKTLQLEQNEVEVKGSDTINVKKEKMDHHHHHSHHNHHHKDHKKDHHKPSVSTTAETPTMSTTTETPSMSTTKENPSVSTTTEMPTVDVNSLEKHEENHQSNDYIYENHNRVSESQDKPNKDYEEMMNYDDDIYDYVDMAKRLRIHKNRRPKRSVLFRLRREIADEIIDDDDDSWLEEAGIVQSDGSASSLLGEENMMGSNSTDVDYYPWIEINATDEIK